jgi:predicted dienelactone hydrolase
MRLRLSVLMSLGCLVLVACGEETASTASDVGAAGADADVARMVHDCYVAELPGLDDVWVPPDPLAAPVGEPGPYSVGFVEDSITHTPEPSTETRTLRTAIWYPTLAEEGEATLYYPGNIKRDGVFAGAEPAPHAAWPVLVFSHGYAGFAENSYFLPEHFASHGWIVIAADHTGNTVEQMNAPVDNSMYAYRPQDVSAMIDHLEKLDSENPLANRADTAKVVVSGHSYGGYTTLVSCGVSFDTDTLMAQCEAGEGATKFCDGFNDDLAAVFSAGLGDPRIVAGIPMAPGDSSYLSPGLGAVEVPVMQIVGGLDGGSPADGVGDGIWEALVGSQHARVHIATAGHQSFTVMCEWFPGVFDDCDDEFMDSEEVHRITNSYALAFARHHVLDDGGVDGILDGSVEVNPEVTLLRKP